MQSPCRPVLAAAITFSTIAFLLWSFSIDAAFAGRARQEMSISVGGASCCAVIAAGLWALLWAVRMRDRSDRARARADLDLGAVLRTLADVVPARQELAKTLPLPRPIPFPTRHAL